MNVEIRTYQTIIKNLEKKAFTKRRKRENEKVITGERKRTVWESNF